MPLERYHYLLADTDRKAAYLLFDRLRGHGDKYDPDANRIATVYDSDLAQRIVNLLNADAARLERQGVRVA